MGQSRWMMMTALTAGMMAVMAVTGWAAQPGMHRAGAVSDTARTIRGIKTDRGAEDFSVICRKSVPCRVLRRQLQ